MSGRLEHPGVPRKGLSSPFERIPDAEQGLERPLFERPTKSEPSGEGEDDADDGGGGRIFQSIQVPSFRLQGTTHPVRAPMNLL